MSVDTSKGYNADLSYWNVDFLLYSFYQCSQQTIKHLAPLRNETSEDKEKAYICLKCTLIVKGSLKLHTSLLKTTNASTMVEHGGHCICEKFPSHFLPAWKGANTKEMNRNVLSPRCRQGICLCIVPEGFYSRFKGTNLLNISLYLPQGVGLEYIFSYFYF